MRDADHVVLGIYLNHDVDLSPSTTVTPPLFRNQCLNATHVEIASNLHMEKQELILRPSELENNQLVYFKKRPWDLSQSFRIVVGHQWPKFVLTATSYKDGNADISAVSSEFEVRSKEQSRKSKASIGLSVKDVKRRRTPETEARASKLRIIHAKIIEIRAAMIVQCQQKTEYQTRLEFMKNIIASEPQCYTCQSIKTILKQTNINY